MPGRRVFLHTFPNRAVNSSCRSSILMGGAPVRDRNSGQWSVGGEMRLKKDDPVGRTCGVRGVFTKATPRRSEALGGPRLGDGKTKPIRRGAPSEVSVARMPGATLWSAILKNDPTDAASLGLDRTWAAKWTIKIGFGPPLGSGRSDGPMQPYRSGPIFLLSLGALRTQYWR